MDKEFLSILPTLSLATLCGIALVLVSYNARGILTGFKEWQETKNRGQEQNFAAQANVVAAGTEAMQIAVGVLRDASSHDRKEMDELKGRVSILEKQGDEKDAVIRQQGAEIEKLKADGVEKDATIERLKEQLEKVQKELNAKRKGKLPLQKDGDGNHPVPVGASGK